MTRITIINGNDGDDSVIKDGRPIAFPVDSFLPDLAIWAVQWYGAAGEIEYSNKQPAAIDNLDDFSELLAEYDRLVDIEDNPPAPPLADLKAAAIVALSAACEAAIIAGFESSALGSVHTYPSTRDDQTNLLGLKVEGADNPLVCFNGIEWDNRLHTYAQIEQVFSSGVARKLDLIQNQFHTKRAAVNTATNQAEIDAVDHAFI